MKQRVIPERMRAAMARKSMTVKKLMRKVSSGEHEVSERTIARLRSGEEPVPTRPQTIHAIAAALDVRPDYLTGDTPDAESNPPDANSPETPFFTRWNIRLPTAIRNAYGLVANRYHVPASHLVELAPLLFLLVAEEALAARSQCLKDMRDAYAERSRLARQARHLTPNAAFDWSLEAIYDSEQSSIDKHDLYAATLLDDERLTDAYEDYDQDEDNPFASFLRSIAAKLGTIGATIEIGKVSLDGVEYNLCREHALVLADGDESLADDILGGSIPLHELPTEFRRGDRQNDRLEWFRRKVAERREALRQQYGTIEGLL